MQAIDSSCNIHQYFNIIVDAVFTMNVMKVNIETSQGNYFWGWAMTTVISVCAVTILLLAIESVKSKLIKFAQYY